MKTEKQLQFDIQLTIGDQKLSKNSVQNLSIINGIKQKFPILHFELLLLSSKYEIIDNIKQKEKCVLTIIPMNGNNPDTEIIKMDLTIIDEKVIKPEGITKNMSGFIHGELKYFAYSFRAIPTLPYKNAYRYQNKIYHDKKIKDIIKDLVCSDEKNKPILNFIDEIDNNEKIDQILLPPDTFDSHIKYINEEFGIYNGELLLYYTFNKIWIGDISKMKKLKPIKILALVSMSENRHKTDDWMKEVLKGAYVSYRINIYQDNITNSKIINNGFNYRIVTKPKDDLFVKDTMNKDKVCENFVLMSDSANKNVQTFDYIKEISQKNIIEYCGYKNSQILYNSKIAATCSDFRINLVLQDFINFSDFMLPGIQCDLEIKNQKFLEYSGLYTLLQSTTLFERFDNNNWVGSISINLGRGRGTKTDEVQS